METHICSNEDKNWLVANHEVIVDYWNVLNLNQFKLLFREMMFTKIGAKDKTWASKRLAFNFVFRK